MKRFLLLIVAFTYITTAQAQFTSFDVDFSSCKTKSQNVKKAQKERMDISIKMQKELEEQTSLNSNFSIIKEMEIIIALAKKYECEISEINISHKKS